MVGHQIMRKLCSALGRDGAFLVAGILNQGPARLKRCMAKTSVQEWSQNLKLDPDFEFMLYLCEQVTDNPSMLLSIPAFSAYLTRECEGKLDDTRQDAPLLVWQQTKLSVTRALMARALAEPWMKYLWDQQCLKTKSHYYNDPGTGKRVRSLRK